MIKLSTILYAIAFIGIYVTVNYFVLSSTIEQMKDTAIDTATGLAAMALWLNIRE